METDMTLGQVAICRGGGALARIVSATTRSPYSHVIIDVGGGMVASAEIGGLRLRPVAEFADYDDPVWSRFDLHDWQAEGVAQYARARLGTRYNVAAGAYILVTRALVIATPSTHPRAYYQCAQLAEDALAHGAGILVFPEGRTAGPATPADFENLFRYHGWL
jgi:hypothetical protein